jgi:hypothetical protein
LKTYRTDDKYPDRSASAETDDSPATLFGVVGGDDPSTTETPVPALRPNGSCEPPTATPPIPPASTLNSDPFDPVKFRLPQRSVASVSLRKRLTTVPVRKPSREWFVRCHPLVEYRLETAVVELKEDRETYLVVPELWDFLAEEATFSPRLLSLTVTRAGTPFLWPVRLRGPDGRIDSWNGSALEAVATAESTWVRVSANMQAGAYDVVEAVAYTDEPVWPTESMNEILGVAFRGKLIDSMDHPVLRRLRGEV